MKYIKLYEAFDSKAINSVFKFLSQRGMVDFKKELNNLKLFCNIPISKLSDDLFEYLPYNKAINLYKEPSLNKCTAESSTIKGEFCTNGYIKRTWGKGVRTIPCPDCDGTGYEKIKYKPSFIKYWFNIDGDFIGITISDKFSKNRSASLSGGHLSVYNIDSDYQKYANFAIVLDFEKLENISKNFNYLDIVNKRKDSKSNALALMKDDDIRKINIKRYLDKIKELSIYTEDDLEYIKKYDKIILRILGGKDIIFYLLPYSNFTINYSYLAGYLYGIFNSDVNKSHYIYNYNIDIQISLDKINKNKELLDKSRKDIYDSCKEDDNGSKYILDELIRLSDKIYNILSSIKIENLDDLEIFTQDIEYIRNILNSERLFSLIKVNRTFISNITGDGWRYVNPYINFVDDGNFKEYIRIVETILDKKFK